MTDKRIVIVGLGFGGLPLAVEFGKKYQTVGFDFNRSELNDLMIGINKTLDIGKENFENTQL
jgi:UDP-N-acetyl-D-glucosamine/UDP-N-acetyl-D-galactosamine dehydrogenase